MRPLHPKVLAAVILLAALLTTALPTWDSWRSRPPDFALYPAGDARKAAFLSYMGPLIDEENAHWQRDRQRLQALQRELQSGETPSKRDLLWLEDRHRFFGTSEAQPMTARIDALLEHVDEVPRSLALAQAAKESAWGTSRFAVEAFNYFGQRCYQKGCGLVPQARAPGAKFEVRRFDSPQASVVSYMININSHPDYQGFRAYRTGRRALDKPVSGIQAAEQLTQYSERRQAYVDEIQSLIHFNRLERQVESAQNAPKQIPGEPSTL